MTNRNEGITLSDMKDLELDSDLIKETLSTRGLSQSWLAKELNITRQAVYEMLQLKSITSAVKIAGILGIEPKDLIKTVEVSNVGEGS